MTKFVVDAGAVLHVARVGIEVPPEHELLAPTLLRTQTLSALHGSVHHGEMTADEARDLLTRVGPPGLKIRLLGDAVLRRLAWDIAEQTGWSSTYDAEYLALTRLQADAFIGGDRAAVSSTSRRALLRLFVQHGAQHRRSPAVDPPRHEGGAT